MLELLGVCLRARVARAFVVAALGFSASAFAQQADLVVNIDDAPDPGPAGGVFTYTVRVDNNGPTGTTGATLTMQLATGATYLDSSATQGSCTFNAPTLTCPIGAIAYPGNQTVTIHVRFPTEGVYQSIFSASSDLPDPNTSNNLDIPEDTTVNKAADMELVATGPAAPVDAGQQFSYELVARNNGPNDLEASDTRTVSFEVPEGACVMAAPTGSGWSCSGPSSYPACNGETIACTRTGALASGASDPPITVNAVANVDGTITAAFDVSASMPDGNLANNEATVDTSIEGGSTDLRITKTASPATVAVGSNVTYTLTPRLEGGVPPGSTGDHLIVVTDTLPAGVSFVSVTPSDPSWDCEYVVPTVTCTMTGPYLGDNFANMPTIQIVATVNDTGTIGNIATIEGPEDDPVPGNNSSSVNVTGSNSADLTVSKTRSLAAVVPGQTFGYTITPRNNGPLPMVAGQVVTITDDVPAGITVISQPAGTGWTCDTLTLPAAGALSFQCTRTLTANVAANTNFPAINFNAQATATGTLTNEACGAMTGTGPEDDNDNNCGSVGVTSTPGGSEADLSIVKTVSPDPVNAGDELTYTLSVHNAGPGDATNVVISDALASLASSVAKPGLISAAVTTGTGTCTPAGPSNVTSTTVNCTVPTLANGADAVVTIKVRPSIAATGTRNNTGTVNSTEVGDPSRTNNTSTVPVQVIAVADMQVTKAATPSPVHGGAPLTYVLTTRNNGPSNAVNVVTTDPLPADAVFLSHSATGGASCTTPAVGATGGTITCTWATINAGAQQTQTIVVRPLATLAGGTITNTASTTSDTLDSDENNNSTSLDTPVAAPLLDILVNKVDSADPIALNATTRYTITVSNSGPSYGTNLHVVDTFPSQSPTATFSYQGNLTITPPGGSCTQPAIGATSGTLDCTFPGIAAGDSIQIAYDERAESVTSGVSGTTFNTVNVSVDEPETQYGNNQAIEATTTRRTADLSLGKEGPADITPGTNITYTLTVTNLGPNPSTGAQVVDALPSPLTFVSASAGCVNASNTVTCTLGTIPVDGSAVVTITAHVPNPYQGPTPLTNEATVTTVNEIDPNGGNNGGSSSGTPGENPPPPVTPPEPVPALGEAALAALAVLLAGSAFARRRASRARSTRAR